MPSPTDEFKRRWGSPVAFRGLTREQRLKLLCLTAASGSIANLEVALASAGLLILSWKLLDAAAAWGQLHTCKWLRERGCRPSDNGALLTAAVRGGRRHVCEWLLASGCTLPSSVMYAAASGGHEGLLYWLLQHPSGRSVDAFRLLLAGAEGLSLAALQRLQQREELSAAWLDHEDGPALNEQQQSEVVAAAAGSPTPDWQAKVKWLELLGYPRTPCARVAAAAAAWSSGDGTAVGRLQWLADRGYPLHEAAVCEAGSRGDLVAVRFIMEQGSVQPSAHAAALTGLCAAEGGHLALLQYLHASGCTLRAEEVARGAARGGHLPVVAWAAEALQGVTPDTALGLMDEAVEAGSTEVMAWLRERGWSWGPSVLAAAVKGGCVEALEWMVAHGCPLSAMTGQAYVVAAALGDQAAARCLVQLGCPWGRRLLVKCIQIHAPIIALQCLAELGCPMDGWKEAVRLAVRLDGQGIGQYRFELLKWLGGRRPSSDDGSEEEGRRETSWWRRLLFEPCWGTRF